MLYGMASARTVAWVRFRGLTPMWSIYRQLKENRQILS